MDCYSHGGRSIGRRRTRILWHGPWLPLKIIWSYGETLLKVLRIIAVPVVIPNNGLRWTTSQSRKARRHLVVRCAVHLHARQAPGKVTARTAAVTLGHTETLLWTREGFRKLFSSKFKKKPATPGSRVKIKVRTGSHQALYLCTAASNNVSDIALNFIG